MMQERDLVGWLCTHPTLPAAARSGGSCGANCVRPAPASHADHEKDVACWRQTCPGFEPGRGLRTSLLCSISSRWTSHLRS